MGGDHRPELWVKVNLQNFLKHLLVLIRSLFQNADKIAITGGPEGGTYEVKNDLKPKTLVAIY